MHLADLIHRSYRSFDVGPGGLRQSAREVQRAYAGLSRPNSSREELIGWKLMLQKWRRDLVAAVRDPAESATIAGEIGFFSADPEGPRRSIPIPPVTGSRWPFSRWSRDPEFSRYAVRDGAVCFRGGTYLSGDLLITNLNVDGAGIYTVPADPASFGAHVGIYVELSEGGLSFPAVLEAHRNGVRAVPLCRYLEPSFSAYVEVYRRAELTAAMRTRLNHAAAEMIHSVRGYQYYTDRDSPTHANCTDVANRLYQAAGAPPFIRKSFYRHPGVLRNFAALGYPGRDVLSPVDLVTDGHAEFRGVVDNGLFPLELSRRLALECVSNLFRRSAIRLSELPAYYRAETWAIRQIQDRNLIGPLLARLNGFTLEDFAAGPASLIAFIEYLHAELGRMTAEIHPVVVAALESDRGPFDLARFRRNAEVIAALHSASPRVRRLFPDPSG